MEEKIYTVDQIAKLIGMHPKTIRNFIRNGKLRAHKVGKEWRVSGHDLSVFLEDGERPAESVPSPAEAASPQPEGDSGRSRVMVSAVVDIDSVDKAEYGRLSSMLLAVQTAGDPGRGRSTVDLRYFERERRLKVMIWGQPTFVEGMIGSIAALTEE